MPSQLSIDPTTWAKDRPGLDTAAPHPASPAAPLGFPALLLVVGGLTAFFGLFLDAAVLLLAGVPLLGVALFMAIINATT